MLAGRAQRRMDDVTRRRAAAAAAGALLALATGCSAGRPATRPTTPAVSSPVTPSAVPGGSALSPADSGSDWPTYHRDNARTGAAPDVPAAGQLTPAWSTQLDGAVYAQPLVVGGRVIVASESNTVAALDAGSGKELWHTTLGPPVPLSLLPCGNINPLGITGTPAYDAASGLVFAVTETRPDFAHTLVGLEVATGAVKVRRVIDPAGSAPKFQQERAALAVSNEMVYVALGGLFGDCGDYHGYVVGSRTDGTGPLAVYQVPTKEAGIWAPPGPAIDSSGDLYVAAGNGAATSGAYDGSDSVIRLSPALRQADFFAPRNWAQENSRDADLGSTGPTLLPGGLVFQAGKTATSYLLRADHLGGIGGQAGSAEVCRGFGGTAVQGSTVFVPCSDGVRSVTVTADALAVGWHAPANFNGSPVVGGGLVWVLDARAGDLAGLDAATGAVRTTSHVGPVTRFASPTLSGNRIFVPTMGGVVALATS